MKRLLALFLFMPLLAQAEPAPQQRLQEVQRQIEASTGKQAELEDKAEELSGEVTALRRRLVEATAQVEKTGAELDELESGLLDLEGAAARRATQLAERRREMGQTLALLQRLALVPPAAQMVSSSSPVARIRTDMQLRALLPQFQSRSRELAEMVQDMRHLRTTLESRRREVRSQQVALSRQQEDLNGLVKARAAQLVATRRQLDAEEQKATRLAAQAADLQDLIRRLEERRSREQAEERPPAPRERPVPAGASRRLPVGGSTLVRFGERDTLGAVSKGITLKTRPGAPVVAVARGRVAFAGPFRGYGRILIVEHPGGYHTVMAGLASVAAAVGQTVEAGEPLGVMGENSDPPQQLYFEVRRSGTPVDPLGQGAQRLVSGN
jgi:septal ring factor EnvC (AmiA/AmiB activator)